METRLTTFVLILCAACVIAGCIPFPILPGSDVYKTEDDIEELVDNNANRSDVITELGTPGRQYESVISYKVCRNTAGIGFILCVPFACDGGAFVGSDCFELILEFDDDYRLTGYKKRPFEGTYITPAGSIWETTYPKILREKADHGDVESQFNLYLIEKENPENIKRLCHLAGMGHTKAQMEVARLYWNRYDIDNNRSKSYMWYMLAASTDHSEGFYIDEPTQNALFTPVQLKMATHLQLQSQLERQRHCKDNFTKLIPEGFRWISNNDELLPEAIKGNMSAQWELYKQEKFRGIHDFRWLCTAAEQGDYRARWELAYIYHNGLYGVRKDLVQSVMWYSLVESDGHNPAGVDEIRAQLTPEQLTKAEHLYENWEPGRCKREILGTESNNTTKVDRPFSEQ